MEMEHIDEYSIRILIRDEDLKQRGINLIQMMSSQKEAEKFFFSVIEEFKLYDKFKRTDQVAFHLIPSIKFQNTIELIVSCGEVKRMKTPLKFFEQLKKSSSKISDNKRPLPLDLNLSENTKLSSLSTEELARENYIKHSHFVLELADFEAVIKMAQIIKLCEVPTDLFKMKQKYFFHVHFMMDKFEFKEIENEKSKMLEFGKRSRLSIEILQEHAKPLIEQNALQTLKTHFK
ncbi:MAG: adaptor protein MecA [Lactobacillales bacterium]|jgi:adapter protein MecA 1/2|nr:adaptor protein MecA [Lactobacillales bacterium]